MPEKNLSFANIVATPTPNSWSQAYNAGKLFAVLSLEKTQPQEEENEDKDYLNLRGKEILDTLEQEFFSLESKDLESITKAVTIASEKIPQDTVCSLAVCVITKNILYAFSKEGLISFKRDQDFGNILDSLQLPNEIKSVSGFVKNGDTIILQTNKFAEIIPLKALASSIDHQTPAEIAEALAPAVHEKIEAAAAAVVIKYNEPEEESETEEDQIIAPPQEPAPEPQTQFKLSDNKYVEKVKEKIKIPSFRQLRLNHPKKVYLTIAAILFFIFIASVYSAIKKQEEDKYKAIFSQTYPKAEKKYEEGQSLLGLNQNLARDSFLAAWKILNESKDEFPKNSQEEQKIQELLNKVNQNIETTSGINNVPAKEVNKEEDEFLAFEAKTQGIAFATNGTDNYYLTNKAIFADSKEIVKNESLWTDAVGLGTYLGNIYVLDKTKGGILKFVGASHTKTNYFAANISPDLSKATAMAIDGSIWVLLKDGTIFKFTRGKPDSFTLSGIDKAFNNPLKIYTSNDSNNLYILDTGNSRIVALNKDGTYKEQYKTDVIKKAKDFNVKEKDKKIFILSSGKIYQIDLK